MALSWSGRRRTIYAGTIAIVLLGVLAYVWVAFFSAAPTCFDNRQNGNETGIDCGGSCALVCQNISKLPQVQWARAFQNGAPNIYTLAAYVENSNPGAGAHAVPYVFQLYDSSNKLILEKDGVADIPPVETIPIIEPMVDVGNRTVAHVEFSFNDSASVAWHQVAADSIPSLRVTSQQLSSDGSRLDVTLENDSFFDVQGVTLETVLYDAQGVARAASKSTTPLIARKSSAHVTFTWPAPNSNIARTEITILPSF